MCVGCSYIAIKLATVLASVIERIVNNASPVKLRATLHPFKFGMQETKFNHVISRSQSPDFTHRYPAPAPPPLPVLLTTDREINDWASSLERQNSVCYIPFPRLCH